jgi:hypothetical protein
MARVGGIKIHSYNGTLYVRVERSKIGHVRIT